MAKKKFQPTPTPFIDFVSNEEKIIEDIIKPAIEEHWAGKVRDFRSKGFDDNRIAAMLMINVNKVKEIK